MVVIIDFLDIVPQFVLKVFFSSSSKFFSSGMSGGGRVELKLSPLSLLLGLKRKMLSIAGFFFFTNFSVLSMNVFKYCFSLHIGMFFVEYPKFICSGGRSGQRSRARSRLVYIAFLSSQQLVLELVYTR